MARHDMSGSRLPLESRRQFVRSVAFAAGGLGCGAVSAAETSPARPFKVCVFTDLHFCPGAWTNCEDMSFLERILSRAQSAGCDLVIHLGDLVHGVRTAEERRLLEVYNGFSIETRHVLGNHDQDRNPYEETFAAFGLPRGYYSFDRGGFRFVILDPNYFRTSDGTFVHYSAGNAYRLPKGAVRDWIPPEQLEWLRTVVFHSELPCIVLSHQSLEKFSRSDAETSHAEARRIFNEANARRPGAVRIVMNGHDHLDYLRILDGILYWDVNSANYQYFDKEHDRYPSDYIKTHAKAANCIGWKEPLSAILTLWPSGRIRIEGAASDWLFGISPRLAGLPEQHGGRLISPTIQSVDLSFNYGRA